MNPLDDAIKLIDEAYERTKKEGEMALKKDAYDIPHAYRMSVISNLLDSALFIMRLLAEKTKDTSPNEDETNTTTN